MSVVLAIVSITLVLVAGAIELWWGSAARQQRKASLSHVDQRLASAAAASATRSPQQLPPGTPALPARPATAAQAAEARAVAAALVRPLPWDGLLRRAGLETGWRMPVLLTVPGLLLAWFGAWRVGSWWMAPATLAVYVLLVWFWLHQRIEKLRAQLVRQLPDFLDNMVRLAAIGNSLPMAFQTASTHVNPPLRRLLDNTMLYVRSGLDLDRALQQASQPYLLNTLDLLHVVLGTGVRIGGRADHILQRMSDFMRDLDHSQQDLRATTSEIRMSAWVLGLLPVLFGLLMTFANPQFFNPMFTQPLGHKLLLIALGMELLGATLLYRLTKSI